MGRWSSCEALENVGRADAGETEPSILMPSVRAQKNQAVTEDHSFY